MPLRKIVSGGQTGVDRAALDAARVSGLPVGGWCPRGRRAEDGPIDPAYPLEETPESGYVQRTAWNVRDSDATLILNWGELEGGTALTVRFLEETGKPYLLVALDEGPDPGEIRHWIRDQGIAVLNVAGPRGRKVPGVYERARELLEEVLAGGGEGETE